LRKNPSLKAGPGEGLAGAWDDARRDASGETNLPLATFPEAIPYDRAAIMERPFEFGPPG
jgi:hypothetical protein